MRAEVLRRLAAVLLVALLGAAAAVAALGLTSATTGAVGPGTVAVRASPSWSGGTRLGLPPLGAVSADTHAAPLRLDASVERVDLEELQAVLAAADPQGRLEASVERDLRPLLRTLVLRSLFLAAVTGALAAALLPGRRLLHLPAGAAGGVVVVGVLLFAVWRGYDTSTFSEPTFEGSLARAPDVLRAVSRHVEDLAAVREKVTVLGRELSSLYESLAAPVAPSADETRLLHVSDVHLNPLGVEIARQLADRFNVTAILDTGDLTSFGFPVEARIADLLVDMPVPYVVVPGNHDSPEVRAALATVANVVVLDGPLELGGVRVLGIADPTFTADNELAPADADAVKRRAAADVARRVTAEAPDVLAVHDPILASRSTGRVPLVVAGHVHKRGNTVTGGTRVLTVGSSGATGLGSFTVEGGRAYEAQVLSFRDGHLTAIDYVSIKGVAGSFRIDRVVVPVPETAGEVGGEEAPAGAGTGTVVRRAGWRRAT